MSCALNGFASCVGQEHNLTICARKDLVRVIKAVGAKVVADTDISRKSDVWVSSVTSIFLQIKQTNREFFESIQRHFQTFAYQTKQGKFLLCDELKGGIIAALCTPVFVAPFERHHLKIFSSKKIVDDISAVEEELVFDDISGTDLKDDMLDTFSCNSVDSEEESIEFSVQYNIFECLSGIQRYFENHKITDFNVESDF